jgi:transcriptional regulator with XRE-family HTH domain
LHAAREAADLTQAQVADKMGVTQTAYGVWERYPVALRPDQIEELARLLNVTVEYLCGRDQVKARGKGPVGKARKVFEEVSQLSRSRQQRIVSVVEDMFAAAQSSSGKPSPRMRRP